MAGPVTPDTSPAPPAEIGPDGRRRWKVGTLTYTAGGLTLLFALLFLADFAWSLKERSASNMFTMLLKQQSDNALLLGALVGALPAFITMTVGPVVGAWSDRTRTRWGRRIPFLLGTAPFIGAGMAGLAFCDEVGAWVNRLAGGGEADLKLAIIVTLGVCWTLFEVATIIGNALFTALINDTVPKVMIGRFFGIFRIFSLGVGAYFYFFVFTNDIMKIHQEVLIAIGAVYVIGFAILCAFVKEGDYPPAPPRSTEGVATNVGRYFQRCFANRFYLLLFGVFGLASTAIYVFNVNAFPAKDQFGLDKTGYGQALAVTYIISMTLAFPIGWLTDRFTPVLLGLITVALYTLVMVGAWFGIQDPRTFQIFFVAHGVLSGAFYTCTAALLLVLLPHGRFSEYASASAALTALLQVVFSLAVGQAIDMTMSFTANGAKDYRMIFLVAGAMSLIAALGWWRLWRNYQAQGGRLGYRPPEDT